MATDNNLLCEWCDDFIPTESNSSQYCSDNCKKEAKREREKERSRMHRASHVLLVNDSILHDLFLEFGSDRYISNQYLLVRNFNWDLYINTTEIENYVAYNMIRYTYILFNDQTVRIWKI
jgi:hypothetical protein